MTLSGPKSVKERAELTIAMREKAAKDKLEKETLFTVVWNECDGIEMKKRRKSKKESVEAGKNKWGFGKRVSPTDLELSSGSVMGSMEVENFHPL